MDNNQPISRDTVVLSCTTDEKNELKKKAKEAGLSLNKYLRSLIGFRIDYKSSGCKSK